MINNESLLNEAKYSLKQQIARVEFLSKEINQRKELLESYVKEQSLVHGDAIPVLPKTEGIDALNLEQLENAQVSIQSLSAKFHVHLQATINTKQNSLHKVLSKLPRRSTSSYWLPILLL